MANNSNTGRQIQSQIDKIISAHNDIEAWREEILRTDIWSDSTVQTVLGRILDIRDAIDAIDGYAAENELPETFANEYPVIKHTTLDDTEMVERSISLKHAYDEHLDQILEKVSDDADICDINDKYAETDFNSICLSDTSAAFSVDSLRMYRKLRVASYKTFLELTGLSDEDDSVDFNKASMYCTGKLSAGMVQQVLDNVGDDKFLKESRFYGLFKDDVVRDPSLVKGVECLSTKANQCKILSDGKSVYTGVDMYPGDIIEICPTKPVDKTALYSKDMRDIVFEVVPNEQYVIPFGYCQYYDLADETHHANCDYMWDPEKAVIVIKAIQKLPKRTRLFLDILK